MSRSGDSNSTVDTGAVHGANAVRIFVLRMWAAFAARRGGGWVSAVVLVGAEDFMDAATVTLCLRGG